MKLRLHWRRFDLALPTPLVTARGRLRSKRGWLLRLETLAGGDGESAPVLDQAWGEAGRMAQGAQQGGDEAGLVSIARAIEALGSTVDHQELEGRLPALPPALAFALGAALGEIQGLVGAASGGWLPPPAPAWLLPAGPLLLPALERILDTHQSSQPAQPHGDGLPLTLKWKVAATDDLQERQLLEQLLERLPNGARLRLDANGGWGAPRPRPGRQGWRRIPAWSGWSNHWLPPITPVWSPWPQVPRLCRWPWMSRWRRIQACATAGADGRCDGLPRRETPGPFWRNCRQACPG